MRLIFYCCGIIFPLISNIPKIESSRSEAFSSQKTLTDYSFLRSSAMAVAMKLNLLLLLSFLAFQSRAEIGGSVVFFDAPGQRFIRSNSMATEGEAKGLSTNEVAATISVLLGSAPVLLSADSSLKLNEVLSPNPFDRPRAVFMMEVTGIKDSQLAFSIVGNAFSSSILGSSKADIELSVEDEVSHLDEPLSIECDAACIGQELAYLGGRYVGTSESQLGVLSFPLAGSSFLNLHLAKMLLLAAICGPLSFMPSPLKGSGLLDIRSKFCAKFSFLIRNITKALENREVFAESIMGPAEILIGRFTGIEALVEEYGSGAIVHQGLELLQTAVTKSFESLQKSYGGKIVGVIISNRELSARSAPVLNVMLSARESRWLVEVNPVNATIAEVILVRRSLAWITGIILLVSTLIGIYYLLYMPLTRDTLLYSNV